MITKAVILSILIAESLTHTPVNTSDVIIVGGHADMPEDQVFLTTKADVHETNIPATPSSDDFLKVQPNGHGEEYVMFVTTARLEYRRNNEEPAHEDSIKLTDVVEEKIEKTEPPGDILFIEGKNNERDRPDPRAERERKEGDFARRSGDFKDRGEFKYIDYGDDEETSTVPTSTPLDCVNLDCRDTIDSVCAAKKDRSELKHRLFKNECFFRKVNCGFSYPENRYTQVDLENCKFIGMHTRRKPYDYHVYFPEPQVFRRREEREEREETTLQPKRRFGGRRSMAMNIGGSFCPHACPVVCTDDYEPECALSAAGERRVFANHCQLDLHSCQHQMMWRRRPLAECTGGKKADMHQNRAFIDWMQRVGIVDKKGKLMVRA